jgi:hypothetical protein
MKSITLPIRYSKSHSEDAAYTTNTRQKPCAICKTFDPGLRRCDIERFVEEKNGGLLGISLETTIQELGKSAASRCCRGCALLHRSLSCFLEKPDHSQLLSILLVLRNAEYQEDWNSDLYGSSLFRLEVTFKLSSESGPDSLEDSLEFFTVEGKERSLISEFCFVTLFQCFHQLLNSDKIESTALDYSNQTHR